MPNPIPLSPEEVATYVQARFPNLKLGEDGNWHGNCVDPEHDGTGESHAGKFTLFSNGGGYNCFSGPCNGHLFDLHRKISGLDQKASAREVYEIVGRQGPVNRQIVATYPYTDANGELLYEKVRYKPKDFRWRRQEASGKWRWSITGVTRVPYRLPEVLQADEVFVVEGEKAADALFRLGVVSTSSGGGAKKWPSELNPHFQGKDVVILPDNDVPGREYRDEVIRNLLPVAKSVKVVELPNLAEKADAFDWIETGGTLDQLRSFVDAVQALTKSVTVVGDQSWCGDAELIVSRDRFGNPIGIKPLLENACRALESAPSFKGALGFNEFRQEAVFLRSCPEADAREGDAVSDNHVRQAARWFQTHGIHVGSIVAGEAIHAVAGRSINHFHPVRDYMRGLTWDGVSRLETWLCDYLGVENNLYTRMVGRCFLTSAVARIMKPGCKVDTMLILEGPQGRLKSTAIERLVGVDAWFTNHLPAIGEKDSKEQLRGKLVIEIAELSAFRGREVEKIKAFISTRVDTYRPPYGRATVDLPRQTVFFGTTNAEAYLEDETGGRRFWPVKVGTVDLAKIDADRDQLWAEAVARYDKGEKWWLDEDAEALASAEQAERLVDDPWRPLIEKWCDDPRPVQPSPDATGFQHAPAVLLSGSRRVLTTEILTHAINKIQATWSNRESQRVAKILRAMGWRKGNLETVGRERVRFYYRPGDCAESFSRDFDDIFKPAQIELKEQ